ncbi:DUF4136 domain-containing protein [Burkholderiaceae bacterium FT117]|uniref:DUF4136 domain-containing protein n=1 Tax=Zeimonas sediminis TaxID=2944268 RepID=UPI002342CA73|nr:DUF4136 domain-containing protein [Zeimonas sediminis]MCM5572322.1 DUF4136 domain-containing protein [Zeimonas sediminis]
MKGFVSGLLRRVLAPLGAAALLAACATPVSSDLTVFHEWPSQAPRTYRFAATETQLDSLEHASYRQQMRGELARVGFTETAQAPRFEVRFDTAVAPRHERRLEYTQPYVQPWFWWGTWGRHGGVSIAAPWPGYYGPYAVERDVSWYEYRLRVEIRDLGAGGRKVYEATAVAAGGAPSIAGAMPYLARAVFADFPGLSGVTRRVEVPREAVEPAAR